MQQRPDTGSFEFTSAQRTVRLLWRSNGPAAFYRGECAHASLSHI